jgi:arylsulfatase A-like enzyme
MRLLFIFLLLAQASIAQRPNIIYIMSDDHDMEAISAYSKQFIQTPNIDRLAKEGMKFQKAFVGNAICAPARATLLTGQHSHKNGHTNNRLWFDTTRSYLPKQMRLAGYQTALIGKWHLKTYPSGFDYWKIVPGQGLYFKPRFIDMNGDTSTYQGYGTDVITDEALSWLDKRDPQKPFMLLLHHKAPHRYFFPPLKYIKAYHNKIFPEPSTLYLDTAGRGSAWRLQTMSILHDMKLSSDLKVDPVYLMDIPHLRPDSSEIAYYTAIMNRIPQLERNEIKEIYKGRGELIKRLRPSGKELLKYKYQWYMQDYLACVASIDENVGRVLDYLDQHKLNENTVVMYTSDQGFYLGENGWFDKRFMYDESMQIPLLVKWPGKIKAGSENQELVQNIDFAPTILDIAGTAIPPQMQGLSIRGLMTGDQKDLDREALYYRFYEYHADHTVLPHLGMRTKKFKLIYFYTVDEWELYDLEKDPEEIHNLYHKKGYEKLVKDLTQQLQQLKLQYEDTEPAGVLK